MKRSRFTEEQIISILREQEAGVAVAELCRKHGVSSPTFYKWKAKFGGLDVSEARRLKALEDENAKLKRMLADAMLDNVALKDLLGKVATPVADREAEPSPETPAGTLLTLTSPRAGLLPPTTTKAQINPGLSLWLDEKRGSRHGGRRGGLIRKLG